MSTPTEKKPSPIEVWLSQRNMLITCRVVHEDESTRELEVDSISMRGAQREMTGFFVNQGYQPIGRWEDETAEEDRGGNPFVETVRKFKLDVAKKN